MNKFCTFFSFIFFIFLNVHYSFGQNPSIESFAMSFSGKVYLPITCTFINPDLTIEFGDVHYSKLILTGGSYKNNLIIRYSCTGGLESSSVSVTLSGDASTFGSNLIKTSLPDLSIKFYIKTKSTDDVSVGMNTNATYSLTNADRGHFLITAELSNNPSAGEFSGEFRASASINFTYI